MNEERPLVIAHRGYSLTAPENTIPAFQAACLAESDLVELDYRHSSDGVPVVIHDRTLDRTTDAARRWGSKRVTVHSRTVDELCRLDAGSWFSPQFAGVRIPTLQQALNEIRKKAGVLIERKDGDARTLIDLLDRCGSLDRVVIQAFDWKFLADCRDLAANVSLGALGPPRRPDGKRYWYSERFLNAPFLDRIEKAGATVVGWNGQVTRESVGEAHARGFKVWIYTINELDTALKLLDLGVDGIISDNPLMVRQALAMRGQDLRGK